MIKFLFKYFISLYKMYRIEKDFAKEAKKLREDPLFSKGSQKDDFQCIINDKIPGFKNLDRAKR